MGIIGGHGWPYLVDRAEVAIEKRAGQRLRDVLAGLRIRREITCPYLFHREAQVGRNALGLHTTEDRLPGPTTVGTGAAVNVLPRLRRRLTHQGIEAAIRKL